MGIVLRCVEADVCNQILVGMMDLRWKALDKIYTVQYFEWTWNLVWKEKLSLKKQTVI